MRSLIVLIGLVLAPSPSPAPSPVLAAELRASEELAADLELAHQCNALAMDKPNAAPLEGLLNASHAPVLEIVYCNRKEKLKSGRDVRSWAYTHCRLHGQSADDDQPPGAAICAAADKSGDSCCGYQSGRLKSVCFDSKGRFKRIEYRCTAK